MKNVFLRRLMKRRNCFIGLVREYSLQRYKAKRLVTSSMIGATPFTALADFSERSSWTIRLDIGDTFKSNAPPW